MNIEIITHCGIPYIFNIDKNSVVKELKIKIFNGIGIDLDEQLLIYMDKTLDNDNKQIKEYGLFDGCKVKLIINFKKNHFMFWIEMLHEQKFSVNVTSNDRLSEVKTKIEKKCMLSPEEQIWIFQGKILEGSDSITSYGIKENSIVNLMQKLISELKIFAKTLDRMTVTLIGTPNSRVIDLKRNIQNKTGIKPEIQRLVYQGLQLKNVRSELKIFAKTLDGITVTLIGTPNSRVIDLKRNIQNKTGIKPEIQRLVYQGLQLKDDKTLKECQIIDSSVVIVVVRKGIQIFAKTTDGLMCALEIKNCDKIISMKKKIGNNFGLRAENLKLLYEGKILQDETNVEQCGIHESSVINIVNRL